MVHTLWLSCAAAEDIIDVVANVCSLKSCTWSQKLLESVESLVRCLHCLFLDAEALYPYIFSIWKVLQLQRRQHQRRQHQQRQMQV